MATNRCWTWKLSKRCKSNSNAELVPNSSEEDERSSGRRPIGMRHVTFSWSFSLQSFYGPSHRFSSCGWSSESFSWLVPFSFWWSPAFSTLQASQIAWSIVPEPHVHRSLRPVPWPRPIQMSVGVWDLWPVGGGGGRRVAHRTFAVQILERRHRFRLRFGLDEA